MSSEKCGTSETHRWRLEPSSTLSLHMRHWEYVIVISQGCSSSLIQLSQEPLSKNSSRHIDWKSLQWHQSTYYLHSVLYFFFSLQLSKRGIVSLFFWHPCSGPPMCCWSLKSCLWFTNTKFHTVYPVFCSNQSHCPSVSPVSHLPSPSFLSFSHSSTISHILAFHDSS